MKTAQGELNLNKKILNSKKENLNYYNVKDMHKIRKYTKILFLKENIALTLISFINIGILNFKLSNIIKELSSCIILSLIIGVVFQIFSNNLSDVIFKNIVYININIKDCTKCNIKLNTLALILGTWAVIVLKLSYITKICSLSLQFILLPPIIAVLTAMLYYQITYICIYQIEEYIDKI